MARLPLARKPRLLDPHSYPASRSPGPGKRGIAAPPVKLPRMPAACVYLLWCGPHRALYTGWTTDLERRLAAHRAGRGAKYTRAHAAQLELAAVIPMPDAAAARREEARIKRLPRTAKLALVAECAARPVNR